MWRTPIGERVLDGAERGLFVLIATQMYEELRYDTAVNSWQSGNSLFDREPVRAQIAALGDIAKAFLDRETAPELYAWKEITLHAMVQYLKTQVRTQLCEPYTDSTNWLSVLSAAMEQTGFEQPSLEESADIDRWMRATEEWANQFWLTNATWQATQLMLDLEPQTAAKLKALLGLHHDYFVELPPIDTNGRYLGAMARFEDLVKEATAIQAAYV